MKRQVVEDYKLQNSRWHQQMEAVTDNIQHLPMDQFVHGFQGFHTIVNSALDQSDRQPPMDQQTKYTTQSSTVFKDFLHHAAMLKSYTSTDLKQVFYSWSHGCTPPNVKP